MTFRTRGDFFVFNWTNGLFCWSRVLVYVGLGEDVFNKWSLRRWLRIQQGVFRRFVQNDPKSRRKSSNRRGPPQFQRQERAVRTKHQVLLKILSDRIRVIFLGLPRWLWRWCYRFCGFLTFGKFVYCIDTSLVDPSPIAYWSSAAVSKASLPFEGTECSSVKECTLKTRHIKLILAILSYPRAHKRWLQRFIIIKR